MDCYVVLGIGEDADQEMIRSAFQALARRYHPYVGAGSS
jgi:DnaJ-class molecular chaperone